MPDGRFIAAASCDFITLLGWRQPVTPAICRIEQPQLINKIEEHSLWIIMNFVS